MFQALAAALRRRLGEDSASAERASARTSRGSAHQHQLGPGESRQGRGLCWPGTWFAAQGVLNQSVVKRTHTAPHADVPGTLWWHRPSSAQLLLALVPAAERLRLIGASGPALLSHGNCFPLLPHSAPLRNELLSVVPHAGTSFSLSTKHMQFPVAEFRYMHPCTDVCTENALQGLESSTKFKKQPRKFAVQSLLNSSSSFAGLTELVFRPGEGPGWAMCQTSHELTGTLSSTSPSMRSCGQAKQHHPPAASRAMATSVALPRTALGGLLGCSWGCWASLGTVQQRNQIQRPAPKKLFWPPQRYMGKTDPSLGTRWGFSFYSNYGIASASPRINRHMRGKSITHCGSYLTDPS